MYSLTMRRASKLVAEVVQRFLDALDPLPRRLLAVFVKHRHDLVFEQVVDGAGVQRVLVLGVGLAVADGPAAGEFGGFVEPAVEDAQVQHAVDAGLHAAGAAGLFAAPRIVEPQVHALHQFARHLHVVVFEEDHVLPQFRIARELHDLADAASCRADPWDAPCRRSRSAPACP